MKTIREQKSSFMGRIMEVKKRSFTDLVDWRADLRLGFPVDLRSFRVRCSRIVGGYVSCWRTKLSKNIAPVYGMIRRKTNILNTSKLTTMIRNQKSHLQPNDSVKYPPAIGPIVGPIKIGNDQIAITFPLRNTSRPKSQRTRASQSSHESKYNEHCKIC